MLSCLPPVWCNAFDSLQRRSGIAYVNAWSAIVLSTSVLHAPGSKFRILSQRNLPGVLTRAEVNRIQCAPGRNNRGISFWVKKLVIAGKAILHLWWRWLGSWELFAFTRRYIFDDSGELIFFQVGKSGHPALASPDDVRDLCAAETVCHTY